MDEPTTSKNKSKKFDHLDPVSVIGILSGFKLACNTNVFHESAELWLVLKFMKRTAGAALTATLSLKSKSPKKKTKEGVVTTNIQVLSHMLKTYATDDVIAEVDNDILLSTQLHNMTNLQFPDAQWMNILRVPYAYDEYVLIGTPIEGFPSSIWYNMHAFWSTHKDAWSQKLAYETISLRTVQAATIQLNPFRHAQQKTKSWEIVNWYTRLGISII